MHHPHLHMGVLCILYADIVTLWGRGVVHRNFVGAINNHQSKTATNDSTAYRNFSGVAEIHRNVMGRLT
jgi:hypothetical protein